MIYKVLVAALLIASTHALKVNAGGMSRRSAISKAASLASLAVPVATFAEDVPVRELKRPRDGDIYSRADSNKLNAARAIERAKDNDLVDGAGATCTELDRLIAVDREAVVFEKEKLDALGGAGRGQSNDPGLRRKVLATKDKLQAQIDKLKVLRKEKNCPSAQVNLKQQNDFSVYKRADENTLNFARAIERAKSGDLVDGSSATCEELSRIIAVDKKAIQFEIDKIEALSDRGSDPSYNEAKLVGSRKAALEAQVKKLDALVVSKSCDQ